MSEMNYDVKRVMDSKIIFYEENKITAVRGDVVYEDEQFIYLETTDLRYTIAKESIVLVKQPK